MRARQGQRRDQERRLRGKDEYRIADQRQPGDRGPFGEEPRGQRRQKDDESAEAQFPSAPLRQVEPGLGIFADHAEGVEESTDRQAADHGADPCAPSSRTPGNEPEDGRPDQIELLLDPQRPQMEQRLQRRLPVEIAGISVEIEIAEAHRGGGRTLAEIGIIVRQEKPPPGGQGESKDEEERGKDTPRATTIEIYEPPPHLADPLGQSLDQQAGDQIAGDDEEDVDADEATRDRRHAVME